VVAVRAATALVMLSASVFILVARVPAVKPFKIPVTVGAVSYSSPG
jgi:hypothetical protein